MRGEKGRERDRDSDGERDERVTETECTHPVMFVASC